MINIIMFRNLELKFFFECLVRGENDCAFSLKDLTCLLQNNWFARSTGKTRQAAAMMQSITSHNCSVGCSDKALRQKAKFKKGLAVEDVKAICLTSTHVCPADAGGCFLHHSGSC